MTAGPPPDSASTAESTVAVQPAVEQVARRPFRHWLGIVLGCVVAGGVVVRLTVYDRLPVFSTISYALPPPVLAGLLVVAALVWRRVRPRLSRLAFVLALIGGGWTGLNTFAFRATEPPADALRVCFWNTFRGNFGWEGIAAEIQQWNADLVGLVEAGDDSPARQQFWATHFSHYDRAVFPHGMVLLVRGQIIASRTEWLSGLGICHLVEIEINGRPATVALVDMEGHPRRMRRQPLEDLHAALRGISGPLIVMGDFNTPTDSVWFAAMRRDYRHAFLTRGTGYAATWPVPLPVLPLDHIWVNDRVELYRCRFGWTPYSDHRPIRCELSFK